MARRRIILVSAAVFFLVVAGVAVGAQWPQPSARAYELVAAVAPRVAPGAGTGHHEERRPLGTWERKVGPVQITLTFTPERMEGLIVIKSKDGETKKVSVDFRADYGVTRDSVLYGVVTSAGFGGKLKMETDELLKGYSKFARELLDQPFSMRFRLDNDALTVKDIRFQLRSEGGSGEDMMAVGLGRYTRKATPKPTVTSY